MVRKFCPPESQAIEPEGSQWDKVYNNIKSSHIHFLSHLVPLGEHAIAVNS